MVAELVQLLLEVRGPGCLIGPNPPQHVLGWGGHGIIASVKHAADLVQGPIRGTQRLHQCHSEDHDSRRI